MIKSVKLKDARELIKGIMNTSIGGYYHFDSVQDDCDGSIGVIFNKPNSSQLYEFWYNDYDMTIDTVQGHTVFLDDSYYDDFDVKVAPVKKVIKQIMVTKYVRDDSND